jgi:hypothetical protein
MKFEVQTITPIEAAKLLGKNEANRKLREHRAAAMARAMREGRFKLTHQPIALSKRGRLLDGQHRLRAIILANKPVKLVVATDVPEETFDVLDAGLPRKMFERLKTNPQHTAVASSLWRFMCRETMQEYEAQIMLDIFGPALAKMDAISRPIKNNRVSKAVQEAAFMLRLAEAIKSKDDNRAIYIGWVLGKLRRADTAGLPSVAISYYLQLAQGGPRNPGIGVSQATDDFVRAWVVLDPNRENVQRLQVNDHSAEVREAREVFQNVTEKVFDE